VPVVIGDQGGNRTPDTRIPNPLVGSVDRRLFLFLIFFMRPAGNQRLPYSSALLASVLVLETS